MGDKCGRQVGDKCKLMRPKTPRVKDKCGRQVWETSVGDKCKLMRPKTPRVGDKWKTKTSVNSCGPRHPEWETSVGDKCERQVGDKSVCVCLILCVAPETQSYMGLRSDSQRFDSLILHKV